MKRILAGGLRLRSSSRCIALFAALGGTAYAPDDHRRQHQEQLGHRHGPARHQRASDIRSDTITGKDIGKDKLGRVPHRGVERLDASKIAHGEERAPASGDSTAKRFAAFDPRRGRTRRSC